jgi:DNA-binding MarR family transcriptional regulator
MSEYDVRTDDELWEQARHLYQTIVLIREKVIGRCVSEDAPELTLPQMKAMWTISEHDHVRVKELAEALGVSAPSASAMVERLVECGMVTREQSPADRREVIIKVSHEGRTCLKRMEQRVLRALAGLLREMGPQHAAMWNELYGRIRDILSREDAAAVLHGPASKQER